MRAACALASCLAALPGTPAASAEAVVAGGITSFHGVGSAAGRLILPLDTSVGTDHLRLNANMVSEGRWAVWIIRRVGDQPNWWERGAAYAYATFFDDSLYMPYDGYGRLEHDKVLAPGSENGWNDPPDGDFNLSAGLYDVMLIADGDVEVSAEITFTGLQGTASLTLTDEATGVVAKPLETRISRDSLLHADVEGSTEGETVTPGVSAFWAWITRQNSIRNDVSYCLARPGPPAFDEVGRCTGIGTGHWGRVAGGGGPFGLGWGSSFMAPSCNPSLDFEACGPGPVRFAYRGSEDSLTVRTGGLGLFISWP